MPYTPTGPFSNGIAPGMSAAFLNNIEAWIALIDNSTPITITGGTNGTATCYQPLQGTLKVVYISEASFRTGGANQDYTLPTPFNTGCMFWCTDVDTFSFRNAGGTNNADVLTAIASGGGTLTSVGNVSANSSGAYVHAIDTIRHNSGAGSSHTGYILLIGI